MKVAHATNCYSRQNGVVVAIDEYHSGLQKLGIESVILAPNDFSTRDENIIQIDGSMWNGDFRGYSREAVFSPEVKEALKDVDLMHIHHISIAFPRIGNPITRLAFDYAKERGKKVVFHNHTRNDIYLPVYSTFCGLPPISWIAPFIARKINVRNCNDADCVIAPSESIEKMLRKWGVQSEIEIVPTSINFEQFSSGDRKRVRADYEIDDKTLVVAYIGRISKEKNVFSLLPIAELAGVKLMFVGEGMCKKELEMLVQRNKGLYGEGRTIFTGQKPYSEIQNYYAAADVIVTASKSETQCLGVWEAHAAGKPVVALHAPGIEDYVQDDNGLLVDSPHKLKLDIKWLNEDRIKLAELAEGARKVTGKRKLEKSSVERLSEIYASLL